MNANKIAFMSFKKEGAISTFSGKSQKLEVQYTNIGINISSTESVCRSHSLSQLLSIYLSMCHSHFTLSLSIFPSLSAYFYLELCSSLFLSSCISFLLFLSLSINRLPIIEKSYLFGKIKHDFFKAMAVSVILYRCTTWELTKKLLGNYKKIICGVSNKCILVIL